MNSCYTDPWNPVCSCDLEPCDLYIFVNNIWFTTDNDDYWDEPGYINFSISWLRSRREDGFVPPEGSPGRLMCGDGPSPTDRYQGNMGDFKIVLDSCNNLIGQQVQIGTDGETITFGGEGRETDVNGLIITRVKSQWGNPNGYIYDYDNIGPDSHLQNGIFGGVNYELMPRGVCASSIISGRTTTEVESNEVIDGDVLVEVRAKYHGGFTGGFDTKFQPKTTGTPGECTADSEYIKDFASDADWDDDILSCFGQLTESGKAFPNKCGYWDGEFAMGGQCDASQDCSGEDYSSNNDFEWSWGGIQSSSPTGTDWDGINHYPDLNASVACGVDDDEICENCWPKVVQPRHHCSNEGVCQRGYGAPGLGTTPNTDKFYCGGLTEPNTEEYCLATYCSSDSYPEGDESNCPDSVFDGNNLNSVTLNDEDSMNRYYNRIRYNDCLQGNYDCISGTEERFCSNPHNGGTSGWCTDFEHPFNSTSVSQLWPISGVGYPNEYYTFDIANDPMCLPDSISSDLADSVCATYFHTFADQNYGAQQIGNWAWIRTNWNTRGNHYDESYNCNGGQCDFIDFEQITDNMFGCTDPNACNYNPQAVEQQFDTMCEYEKPWYPVIPPAVDSLMDGCKPCRDVLQQHGLWDLWQEKNSVCDDDTNYCTNYTWGVVPGAVGMNNPNLLEEAGCSSSPELCVPTLSCESGLLGEGEYINNWMYWSLYGLDIDHTCLSEQYDDCGVCCGEGTINPNCDPDFSTDCAGGCLGGSYFIDDCGQCVGGLEESNQQYFDSCLQGQTWSLEEQIALGLNCGTDGGTDANCCCGIMQDGANSSYTGCDVAPPKFYYYDQDRDGSPCFGDTNTIMSCYPPVNELEWVEGPAPANINQNAFDQIICSDGNPCIWADNGWDVTEMCNCAANYIDTCGVCNGNNSTCEDCNGDPLGSATIDACGNCIKCCTPEEEVFCSNLDDLSARPLCCNKYNCSNPIFDSSSCMYMAGELSEPTLYPRLEEDYAQGTPGGTCKGDWTSPNWENKWCECFTWPATTCGQHNGDNGDSVCSSNGGEQITGWDYKAWKQQTYDGQWWSNYGGCDYGAGVSYPCGGQDRLVRTFKQLYNLNNEIQGTHLFKYTQGGPGELENAYSVGPGKDQFAGYCGEEDSAGDMYSLNNNNSFNFEHKGGSGKIQAFSDADFQVGYEPTIKPDWRYSYAKNGAASSCYGGGSPLTEDCSSNFNKERSCSQRIGRCGVCGPGQNMLETNETGYWLDFCEVCGGDGTSCGGTGNTCNNNCWGHTDRYGNTNGYKGGSYLEDLQCDCSSVCVWFRDCCDHMWGHCADETCRGQIGFGDTYGTWKCMGDGIGDYPCADCAQAPNGDTVNNIETYSFSYSNTFISPSIKECQDGGWGTGWYLDQGSNMSMLQEGFPPDAWCEMVAAAGYVSGTNELGSYGDFFDQDLTASYDSLWGDFTNNDYSVKQKAPWFYCAVEACCQNVWDTSGGFYYCLHYGGVNEWDIYDCDWCDQPGFLEFGSYWYRQGSNKIFPSSPYSGYWNGPYIPRELVDAGLISEDSHCPVIPLT